jgi:hypothetical protein
MILMLLIKMLIGGNEQYRYVISNKVLESKAR